MLDNRRETQSFLCLFLRGVSTSMNTVTDLMSGQVLPRERLHEIRHRILRIRLFAESESAIRVPLQLPESLHNSVVQVLLDRRTILESVTKAGRLLVVDPAPGTCSVASEVAATVANNAFQSLRVPVTHLTAPDVPVPFSPHLERLMDPTTATIVASSRQLCSRC